MNIIFGVLLLISSILIMINNPDLLFGSMINGASSGITLIVKLGTIYAIWLSILDIMDKIGLSKLLHKILSPITKMLFKGETKETHELISTSFALNMLGMGSSATPLSIKAMHNMNNDRVVASDNSLLYLIINATSIQLLPTTIIGLRSASGSASPSDIILPSLIATTIATISGIILAKIFSND